MDIGLIGFGGVGQAFVKLLIEKKKYILKKYNLDLKVKYIVKSDGGIYKANGIDLEEVIEFINKNKSIKEHISWKNDLSIDEIIKNNDIDTLVELTSTNIENGEPGLTHMKRALESGINVVTGNKGPIILKYKELKKIADKNSVKLKVGCTTGGALPSINGGLYDVAGSEIQAIEGILNGTTNYILSKMSMEEVSYEEALSQAQKDGIAEANPSLDVLGYDTASKMVILANVLMGANIKLKDIEVQGITEVKLETIEKARKENKKLKLIGKVQREDNMVKAYVRPIEIKEDHPLYFVDYKNKGVYFKTDILGDISIIGGASGTRNAAASILRDLVLVKSLE
ncbi:homoserine dehydrogenase [Clostridium saudiense]|uniref:Homoserine dehydrogenase n=1 Tax=Clostridium saudiense TaxID=1414720 RepID=A0ABS2FF15_9CLOT|nr:homoserine dehydrogenase [Clostridium saudiense]MBM6819019.1 homoserine dehydrogenase [Clostridium saudiense]